ncbi:MAG: cytochrome C [Acidobacteria bacterium]|nr:MAG: cytochrome C [Acidobacteriota bacterium]
MNIAIRDISNSTAPALLIGLLVLWAFLEPASAVRSPSGSENATAASTYKTRCSGCHGQDGRGDTDVGKSLGVADLHSADVQKQSDAELAAVIANGRNNKMPAFGSRLTKDQIDSLVLYIRELAKEK